jgi:hypothetical protein
MDAAIFGGEVLAVSRVVAFEPVGQSGFFEREMRGQRDGARGVVERQHGKNLARTAHE